MTTPVTTGGTNHPMATCAGPLMENIDNRPVAAGVTMSTHGGASVTIPVGLALMANGPLAGMRLFFLNPFPSS